MALLPVLLALLAPAPVWRVDFATESTPALTWMKANGWKEQRGDADAWRVVDGVLRTAQKEDSTTIGTQRGFPLDALTHRHLRFRFRVLKWPAKGDLRKKGTEDAALRIFILFDHGEGFIAPPDTLGYAFASSRPVGEMITSDRFDNVKYIPIATARGYDGRWIEVDVDLVADYRRAFGVEAVPAIKAIGIKSDGNNTDAEASAEIDWIQIGP
ncbi:MAG: DUF3047 domain-containing protein [Myxococcales bacterium]|nr:DUF3047 domain-containing protein [Myxococcales bacterium]